MEALALHRAVFKFPSGVQIDIESALGTGIPLAELPPIPFLSDAQAESDSAAVLSGGIVPMCWRDAGALFERFQLREDTDYFVDVTVPLSFAEAEARSTGHSCWPFNPRLATAFRRDPTRRWRTVGESGRESVTVTGQLRLRSHAGILSLGTEFGENFLAEVACRKLRYFEEFKELLDCLADELAELLLAYDSPVSLSFGTTDQVANNDSALYFLMRRVMAPQHLPLAIDEIAAAPHSKMYEAVETVQIEEIEELDPELIVDGLDVSVMVFGGALGRYFGGYTPKELPRQEVRETVDTAENRYTKAFIEHCKNIAYFLEARMTSRKRPAAQREARLWANQLDEVLQRSLWKEVGSLDHFPANSQVLIKKRGYKELFKLDMSLRASLALSWKEGAQVADGLIGDVRPVNQIYEFWCFFALRRILQEFCREIGGGDFIAISKDGLRVLLAKGRRSECCFEFTAKNGIVINVSLFYNRRFRRPKTASGAWGGSYSASFDPDFSVHVKRSDSIQSHWLHFDAKYRLERKELEDIFDSSTSDEDLFDDADTDEAVARYEAELKRVHKQDDLYKMHTYRDGILSSRGAYILFPGDGVGGRVEKPNQNFFVRHPSAFGTLPSHMIPSVGAFDFTPNGPSEQHLAVKNLLLSVFEAAAERINYQEENGNFS